MKIKVLSKKETAVVKGKETTFYRYFTPVEIEVFKDGISQGIQKKTIEVHFTKVASKQLKDEKVFAIIDGDIGLPNVYEVEEREDGTLKFPQAWVRSIDSMKDIPYTPKASTCRPLLDEEETESVEIA